MADFEIILELAALQGLESFIKGDLL